MEERSLIPKIVVLGSCSVDFTTYSERLPKPGETLHGSKFVTSFGGKGANQCVASAKLGGNAHMICRLGDDQWGKQYKDHLQNVGIDVSHAYITPNTTTGIAQISVAENGENQIVIVPGANGKLSIDDVQKSSELIESADILIGQLETPFEATLASFKLNKGITLLNAAPARANIAEILPHCNILCVNESEAALVTDIEVISIESAVMALKKLILLGCDTVIITLGENGAVFASKQEENPIHVLCEKITAVDTTGAGDAFVGALATFLVTHKNYPMHQIIGAASEVATISVTKEGTQTSYPNNHKPFSKEYLFRQF